MKLIVALPLCLFFCLTSLFSLGQNLADGAMLVRYQGAPQGSFVLVHCENESAKRSLLNNPLVVDAEPDYPFSLAALPNDPALDQQWGLYNQHPGAADIGALAAWDLQNQSSGVAGIIDTGIDYGHEDLVNNIWQNLAEDADGDGTVLEWIDGQWQLDPGDLDGIDADGNGYIDDLIGWDFVNNDNNPLDDNGHGTHVAGILGATGNNAKGGAGVCWSVQLMALKAFDQRGAGSLSSILSALQYARKQGVMLTNNSWGGTSYSRFLYEEIETAGQLGQLFVAAAGNQGRYSQYLSVYPASYDLDNIVAVGAFDHNGDLASFSNSSPRDVDLFAPGYYIYSTLPGNRYGMKTGTSMATPFVSGALMLLQEHNSVLDHLQLKALLLNTVTTSPNLYAKCRSGGLLNLAAALGQGAQLLSPTANFSAPASSCQGAYVLFENQSSALPGAQYQWYIDDQLVSTDTQLTWQFTEPGFYGVKLQMMVNGETNAITRPIQITAAAWADLGPDTTICASARLLEAPDPDLSYLWKRLRCNGAGPCDTPYDFGSVDSIRFAELNGHTESVSRYYVLADTAGVMLQISPDPRFAPVSAGTYEVYGVYYSLPALPPGLQIGNALMDLDLSSDDCSGITDPLRMEVAAEEIVGSGLKYIVRESGTYILIARDGCGHYASDTLRLNLQEGCVWPGDVDVDGQVTLLDFLALGLADGQAGPPRPQASPLWQSQSAPDWNIAFDTINQLAPDRDLKHADCDGDGLVDLLQDAAVVKANLGAFHQISVPIDSMGAELQIVHANTTFAAEDTALIGLEFYLNGPDGSSLQGVYGLAFQLNFSDPIAKAPDFQADTNSWMAPAQAMNAFWDGSQKTPGIQSFRDYRKTAGFALVSQDGLARNGGGGVGGGMVIVTVDDLSDDPALQGFATFTISIDNLVLVDADGRLKTVSLASQLQTITIEIPRSQTSLLPVEWLTLTARQYGADAMLHWRANEDPETHYYVVERSMDARIFSPVARINAHRNGHNPQEYAFLDSAIVRSGHPQCYYRIKQFDLNGSFSLSEQVYLRLHSDFGLLFQAHPNPFGERLTLRYQAFEAQGLELRVLNSLGQEMASHSLTEEKGEISMDSALWPSGIYYVLLENQRQRKVIKVWKR